MKKFKRLLVVGLSLFALTVSGCGFTEKNNNINDPVVENDNRRELYNLYQASGGELSYEEWLESIKGADGSKIIYGQIDPSTSNGNNGDVYINSLTWDIFIKNGGQWIKIGNIMGPKGEPGKDGQDGAPGKDGKDGKDGEDGQDGAPGKDGKDGKDGEDGSDGQTPYIGSNGNWWIGNVDTGIKAQGQDGVDGVDGKNGEDGEKGLSAYEIFLKYHPDYNGTEEEWINDVAQSNVCNLFGHKWDNGRITKEPTLDECGNRAYECAVCGQVLNQEIPKIESLDKDIYELNGIKYVKYGGYPSKHISDEKIINNLNLLEVKNER